MGPPSERRGLCGLGHRNCYELLFACAGPSDSILTQRTSGEEVEGADSDPDGMDHRVTEESQEEPALEFYARINGPVLGEEQ